MASTGATKPLRREPSLITLDDLSPVWPHCTASTGDNTAGSAM